VLAATDLVMCHVGGLLGYGAFAGKKVRPQRHRSPDLGLAPRRESQ
jgi:hypothetical protein